MKVVACLMRLCLSLHVNELVYYFLLPLQLIGLMVAIRLPPVSSVS